MAKELRRSSNRVIFGVCGGLAESTGMSPGMMRFLWILFSLLGGSGVLVYLIMTLVMKPPVS